MQPVKQQVLDAISASGRFMQGDSFRIRHREKSDGTICSFDHDDPAMVVTRMSNCWVYFCHRCHCMGTLSDSGLSPTDTRKRIEARKRIPVSKVTEKVDLPNDFQQMQEKVDHDQVPWEAYHWLWRYDINAEDMLKFHIGWSPSYRRVIFPLYEYAEVGDAIASKLVGWVGREVKYHSKEERKKAGVVKWLTRSKKGKRRYFVAYGKGNVVILCEDSVSAIKVNKATGYTTIGLLTTHIEDNLMRMLRGKTVLIWLDPDMKTKAVKYAARFNQLGISAKFVDSDKDPKDYSTIHIEDRIGEVLK